MKSVDAVQVLKDLVVEFEKHEELGPMVERIIAGLSVQLKIAKNGGQIFEKPVKCKYQNTTDRDYTGKTGCRGKVVDCTNTDNPVKEWYECGCNKTKCLFYEAE